MNFIDEYNIDPVKHKVCVLGTHLERPEGITRQDMMVDSRIVMDAVFNSRLYVVKALFDDSVKKWEFAGPRHPND